MMTMMASGSSSCNHPISNPLSPLFNSRAPQYQQQQQQQEQLPSIGNYIDGTASGNASHFSNANDYHSPHSSSGSEISNYQPRAQNNHTSSNISDTASTLFRSPQLHHPQPKHPQHQRHQSQPPSLFHNNSNNNHTQQHQNQQQEQQQQQQQQQNMNNTMYSTTHHHGQTHQRSHSTSIAPIDQFQFSVHQEQTTLVLGVLNYLERLEREVADMREFVKLGFRQDDSVMGDMGGGLAGRLENARLQARNWNRTNVTELDEPFRILPLSTGDYPTDIPNTGDVLKDASHKVIDQILDLYDIPFIPTMFLMEKKMLYLRFLGANRVVMHRILD